MFRGEAALSRLPSLRSPGSCFLAVLMVIYVPILPTMAASWDADTKREYRTVNGVAARGGSMDGPGAVVVGGMLYVGSGYGLWGGTPGNVLLAYSLDGR